jgi:hypothetical protein
MGQGDGRFASPSISLSQGRNERPLPGGADGLGRASDYDAKLGLVDAAGRMTGLVFRATFVAHRCETFGAAAMAEIYGLYSGRDGRVRYVGETGDSTSRFKEHLRTPSASVHGWFHREWRDGYPIECVVLQESVDQDKRVRCRVERHWMAKFPGLLNQRISADTWFRGACAKPPKIPEITAYMRRYYFNVGGFRGVHYDRYSHYYFVLMYTGFGTEWLLGNEMPDCGGNIWFSDRTAAIMARDKERKSRSYNKWLPDIQLAADEPFSLLGCRTSLLDDLAILEDALSF